MKPGESSQAGVAEIYGQYGFTNLFPSGQHWDEQSATVLNNHEETENVCFGFSFTALTTVVNVGTTAATYDQQLFLDDDPGGNSPDLVSTWKGTVTNARSYTTSPFLVSLGNLSLGTYFLFHRVDSSQQVQELHENDNMLRYSGTIVVTDCLQVFSTFGANTILYL